MEKTQDTSPWYLYILRINNGSLYTGITTNVERRITEHQQGGKKAAKYLRGKGPIEKIFSQKIGSRSEALQIERAVKKLSKAEKESIVQGNGDLTALLR